MVEHCLNLHEFGTQTHYAVVTGEVVFQEASEGNAQLILASFFWILLSFEYSWLSD